MRSASAANMVLGQPGRACILVVEDELLIRCIISEIMRDAGYTVIEAANGDEALEIVRSDISLDLVFSDVKMPGAVDGLGLLAAVKSARPELPVVITSGDCDPALALEGGAAHFVRKPYDLDAVVELVRDELERPE